MEYLGIDKPINKIKPLVSVVVPTYQHKNYIANCIEGILNQQTDFDFEVVIGEDCSTDGTREICKHYAERYPDKIRLFLRDRKDVICIDGRPTGRFNFVQNLRDARGKYLAECEGDDYWTDPLKLQKQFDLLKKKTELSWCFHKTEVINEIEGHQARGKAFANTQITLYGTEEILRLGGGFFSTSSMMFRADAVQNLPDFFLRVKSADFALVLILSLYGKGEYIDEPMCVYRIHMGGIFSSVKHDHLERINTLKSQIYLLNEFNRYSDRQYTYTISKRKRQLYRKIMERYLKHYLGWK